MGAEVAAKEFNIKLDFTSYNYEADIKGQIALVNAAVERKTDAIILAPSDYTGLIDVAEKAVSKKIPVIIVDSKLNSNKISSYIATDNVKAGKVAGKKLVALSGTKARIVIINSIQGVSNGKEREEGFRSVISKYPQIKLIKTNYVATDSDSASSITKNIMMGDNKINTVIAFDATASIGVAKAIEEMGMTGKVNVITFDNTPEEIEFLEKGVIQAIVVQSPFGMGYLAVKDAVQNLEGKKIPKYVDTGLIVIDRDNMYLPENQKILFPFTQ